MGQIPRSTERISSLKLKCTKFDFSWGPAPDPAGELAVLLQTLAEFKGPTFKGRKRRNSGKGRVGEGMEGENKEREGGEVGKGKEGLCHGC